MPALKPLTVFVVTWDWSRVVRYLHIAVEEALTTPGNEHLQQTEDRLAKAHMRVSGDRDVHTGVAIGHVTPAELTEALPQMQEAHAARSVLVIERDI